MRTALSYAARMVERKEDAARNRRHAETFLLGIR
jgi:hypothetical protein